MTSAHLFCVLAAILSFSTFAHAANNTLARNESAPLSTVLLVSFDGFRADYLQKYRFPNLQMLYSEGVLVDHLTNVFITKTFPNHYSLVTGLYAESHGIVANVMYDPVTKKRFSSENDTDPFWWNEATPIWVSVQDSGFKAAAAMWPGTDVAIHNQTSTYFMKYDSQVTFQDRVNTLTKWLADDKAVRFASLYWHEPDQAGHMYGPDNETEMAKALKEVDDNIGLLIETLKQSGLWGKINVIVTSDHGMVQCSQDRLIRLDSCLDASNYTLVLITPVAAIIPLTGVSGVYNALKKCHPRMKAYLKADILVRLHYKDNERIQPIILVADEGWTIVQRGNLSLLGDHGYDNSLPSMHPFLAAYGPAFRKGYRLSQMNSVDLYPLMCHILAIQEKPNNGSFSNSRCLLITESCIELPGVIGIVIGALMVLTTLTCLFILLKNRVPSSSRPFARLELQEDDDDDPLID
ncbi:bis(5'-adenosyl)-triphosphatase enpp4 [Scleropages formosus]|uniref:bis(5'-adenosyl)-triphosphatase n=2 Tax=Scleropages formosus TaxID=113540 RepID=A0A8C9RIR3_SCLFO|nr:bis(5'-adenosyl)-triphosphatase ENPP4 [Scleropages formosus]XP_018599106.1 bis(5'-adenosyl)-triphosphatase ENPP4 [Scleropages formosus]XP_029103727.1 bis(5'-adenosyl)-triphosphatase ENPP4 [Scleropages formosus]